MSTKLNSQKKATVKAQQIKKLKALCNKLEDRWNFEQEIGDMLYDKLDISIERLRDNIIWAKLSVIDKHLAKIKRLVREERTQQKVADAIGGKYVDADEKLAALLSKPIGGKRYKGGKCGKAGR